MCPATREKYNNKNMHKGELTIVIERDRLTQTQTDKYTDRQDGQRKRMRMTKARRKEKRDRERERMGRTEKKRIKEKKQRIETQHSQHFEYPSLDAPKRQ